MPPRAAPSRIFLLFSLFLAIGLVAAGSQSFHRHSFKHHKALDRRQVNDLPSLPLPAPDAEPTDSPEENGDNEEEGDEESSSVSSDTTSTTTTTSSTESSSSSSTTTSSSSSTTTTSSTSSEEEETSITESTTTTTSSEEESTTSTSRSSSSSESSSSESTTSPTASSTTETTSSSSTLTSPTPPPAIPTNPTPDDLNATGDGTPQESSAPDLSGAASSSFWENKGAVAGTFVSVGIFVLACILFAFWRVRRRQFSKRTESAYFERHSRAQSPDFGSGDGHHTMADLSNEPPLTAYPNRDIHYDNIAPPPIIPVEYGATRSSYLAYPPGTGPYTEQGYGQGAMQNQGGAQQWNAATLYGAPAQQAANDTDQTDNSYPAQTARRRSNNPFHDTNAARGSYQPSVDSFYGGNAQSGNPYTAYAS